MKRKIIGLTISLIGIALMGLEMGRNSKTGENNDVLHNIGLFLVFSGVLIFFLLKKNESND